MKNENDNVFYLDFDDPPFSENVSVTQQEVDHVTEETWGEVKNSLQDLLWRAENADNPAFDDQTILEWINQYAEKFDQFYQEKRALAPEQLITWWKQSKSDSDTIDVHEFVLEWVAFKNRTDIPLKESIAA